MNGEYLFQFGTYGMNDGQFRQPIGLAVNSKGDIIVCEYGGHSIQIFDWEGHFISKFGSYGNGDGQFSYPWGVCVTPDDSIIIADTGNNRIQMMSSTGQFISKLSTKNNPCCVYIDSNGRILVGENGGVLERFN